VPESFRVLIKELAALCLNVIAQGAKVEVPKPTEIPLSEAIEEEKKEEEGKILQKELGGEEIVSNDEAIEGKEEKVINNEQE